MDKLCERQHKTKVSCTKQNDGCHRCIQEDKEMERRARRDLQLEEDRRRREETYTKELQAIQDELEHQRRISTYQAKEEERKQTLEQTRADLAAMKDMQAKRQQQTSLKAAAEEAAAAARAGTEGQASHASSTEPDCLGGAHAEWQFMKESEGVQSKPLEQLMEMIGLEEVKQAFLSIKSKVDTALRQGVSLASERFSCSMLGNPGTG